MSKWFSLITEFHAVDHPDSPESLVIGPRAAAGRIDALEEELGFRLPEEFRDLYGVCDGFGRREGDETIWLFVPLDRIVETSTTAREWFKKTHPELAAGYVAFVDWDCGDYSGYVFGPDGTIVDGIFDFDHESYEFDKEQDFAEFLSPLFLSIEDFFELSCEP